MREQMGGSLLTRWAGVYAATILLLAGGSLFAGTLSGKVHMSSVGVFSASNEGEDKRFTTETRRLRDRKYNAAFISSTGTLRLRSG